jgi:ABC-type transport system involved in cytochrome bd biosynthesis fused ATPase/permease subunit
VSPPAVKKAVARISGRSGCVKRTFRAVVTGQNIKSVRFTIDGRTLKTFRGTRARYAVAINPQRYSIGVHRVRAHVVFVSGATKKSQTLRFAFQRCKQRVVRPRTTG